MVEFSESMPQLSNSDNGSSPISYHNDVSQFNDASSNNTAPSKTAKVKFTIFIVITFGALCIRSSINTIGAMASVDKKSSVVKGGDGTAISRKASTPLESSSLNGNLHTKHQPLRVAGNDSGTNAKTITATGGDALKKSRASSSVLDKYNQLTVDDNNTFNTTASATKSKALKKSTRKKANKGLSVTYDDTTLMKYHEAISGIVLEEYKLVIFTNPKIGSTVSGYSVVSKNTTTVTHQY